VLGVDGQDHHRILAALALVNGRGVGEVQLVQLVEVILHDPIVEPDMQFLLHVVDLGHAADVAVEHVFVVVVDHLHDLVAHAEGPAVALDGRTGRVQCLLEDRIEVPAAQDAPLHGREHLDVVHAVKAELLWDVLADQAADHVHGLVGVGDLNEVEVRAAG
jgi:hypothetical protein